MAMTQKSGLQQHGWAKASNTPWIYHQEQRLYLIQHNRVGRLWAWGHLQHTEYIHIFQPIYTERSETFPHSFHGPSPPPQDKRQIVRCRERRQGGGRRWRVRGKNIRKMRYIYTDTKFIESPNILSTSSIHRGIQHTQATQVSKYP